MEKACLSSKQLTSAQGSPAPVGDLQGICSAGMKIQARDSGHWGTAQRPSSASRELGLCLGAPWHKQASLSWLDGSRVARMLWKRVHVFVLALCPHSLCRNTVPWNITAQSCYGRPRAHSTETLHASSLTLSTFIVVVTITGLHPDLPPIPHMAPTCSSIVFNP